MPLTFTSSGLLNLFDPVTSTEATLPVPEIAAGASCAQASPGAAARIKNAAASPRFVGRPISLEIMLQILCEVEILRQRPVGRAMKLRKVRRHSCGLVDILLP
jgi:hypothetical protein